MTGTWWEHDREENENMAGTRTGHSSVKICPRHRSSYIHIYIYIYPWSMYQMYPKQQTNTWLNSPGTPRHHRNTGTWGENWRPDKVSLTVVEFKDNPPGDDADSRRDSCTCCSKIALLKCQTHAPMHHAFLDSLNNCTIVIEHSKELGKNKKIKTTKSKKRKSKNIVFFVICLRPCPLTAPQGGDQKRQCLATSCVAAQLAGAVLEGKFRPKLEARDTGQHETHETRVVISSCLSCPGANTLWTEWQLEEIAGRERLRGDSECVAWQDILKGVFLVISWSCWNAETLIIVKHFEPHGLSIFIVTARQRQISGESLLPFYYHCPYIRIYIYICIFFCSKAETAPSPKSS